MSGSNGDSNQKCQSSAVSGKDDWIEPAVSYVDPTRRFCEFCGRPIARKYWQAETERGVGIFCDPAHATLYTTYPMNSKHADN